MFTKHSKYIAYILNCTVMFLSLFGQTVYADRDSPYIHRFFPEGEVAQIEVVFPGVDESIASDELLEQWKQDIAEQAAVIWILLLDNKFKAPSSETGAAGEPLLRINLDYSEFGSSGNAGAGSAIRVQAGNLSNSTRRAQALNTLRHEMFHMTQTAYSDQSGSRSRVMGRYINTLSEGTAKLAETLLSEEQYNLMAGRTSCDTNQLKYPGSNLWFRPAGENEDVVCMTMLWWRYFTQQFSSFEGYRSGIDTMARLYNFLEPATGWKVHTNDRFPFVADLTGDGRSELLAQSNTHIGLLNPVFPRPGSGDIVPVGSRIDGGWRYSKNDQVVAACNIAGSKKNEFVIVSDSHLAAISTDEDGQMQTFAAVQFGSRMGNGWVLKADDQILGQADFDGDGYCELIIQSTTHIGAVGFTHAGRTRTLFAHTIGSRLPGGWKLDHNDRFLSGGDLNGNGSDEAIFSSATHLAIFGYDVQNRSLTSHVVRTHNGLTAGNFTSSNSVQALGIARVSADRNSSLVLFDGDTIISLRLDSNNVPDTEVIFEVGDILSASLADLNGDGLSEVVLLPHAGGLRIVKLMPNNSYASRNINTTQDIRDGFNGEEYRSRWNLNSDRRIRAIGDFDGDGADELLFSDHNRLVSLSIPDAQTPKLRSYRTFNSDRFDNLPRKLDDFITVESLGGRSLNSMLTDYTVANVLSSHWHSGISTRYKYKDIAQYPNMVDYDLNPSTYSVKFSAKLDPNVTTQWDNRQSQWSEQYVRLDLTGGAAQFVFERKRPSHAGAIRIMVFDEREFIEMHELDGLNSTIQLDYPAGFTAIVAIVAHEVPMDYSVELLQSR